MGSCSGKSMRNCVKETTTKKASIIKVTAQTFIKASGQRFLDIYKIGKCLGKGSYGEVRLVTERKTGQERAVKIFRKSVLQTKKVTEQLHKEIEILKKIDHPNIIKIFEYFEDEKKMYIIMEKCEGGELYSQILKLNSFSEAAASKIIRQLLLAVCYLHERQIVHRDIKPENILFNSDGVESEIKLIDFGVAEVYNHLQVLKDPVGTIFYIAPEVLEKNYDEKCDLWSCGVIAYMLLCGSPPFAGANDVEIIKNIKIGSVNFNKAIWQSHSAESKDFILNLLCKAELRFSARAALEHPWVANSETLSPCKEVYISALSTLKAFHNTNKLKEAVRTYIASQCLNIHETKELTHLFNKIDSNQDGRLSKEEIIKYYDAVMGSPLTDEEANEIMKEVDSDKSGFVDYSEFIKATMSEIMFSNVKHLKLAFDHFDADCNGKISADEIKKVLQDGNAYDEDVWKEIVREVDRNSDGEIDFKEFTEAVLR